MGRFRAGEARAHIAMRSAATAIAMVALAGCGSSSGDPPTGASSTDRPVAAPGVGPTRAPLDAALVEPAPTVPADGVRETFDTPSALTGWRVSHGEAMSGPPSEVSVVDGALQIVSAHSQWLDNQHGTGVAVTVDGDVRVVATVNVAGTATPDPTVDWSLAGIMLREPGDPAYENWVHWSAGHVQSAVLERKNTRHGGSQLQLIGVEPGPVALQLIRAGDDVFLLHRQGSGSWTVDYRFPRPDLPTTAEVLLTAQSGAETDHGDMVARFDDVSITPGPVPESLHAQLLAGDASGLTS